MFRPVRKKANEISVEEAKKLLHEARRGVLAVSGDDGYPYAVPINYLYDEDAQEIIFHGSKVGHKVDALKRSDKVCFTVVSGESVEIEDEAWAPFFEERRRLWPLPSRRGPRRERRAVQKVRDEILPHRENGRRRSRRLQQGRPDVPHQHRPHQRQKGAGEVMKKETRKRLFFIAIKYYQFAEKI